MKSALLMLSSNNNNGKLGAKRELLLQTKIEVIIGSQLPLCSCNEDLSGNL
jgi:hypothetical protein